MYLLYFTISIVFSFGKTNLEQISLQISDYRAGPNRFCIWQLEI